MEFILVSPGSFQMGSESGEWNEKPVHKVTISDYFYISRDEVTAAQYRAFDPGYSGSGYATGLSWYDANDFAQWLSQQEAVSYRLPTEAEWEYACRYASNINNMLSSPVRQENGSMTGTASILTNRRPTRSVQMKEWLVLCGAVGWMTTAATIFDVLIGQALLRVSQVDSTILVFGL